MIKAVLFDFFNTLAQYSPSREEVYFDLCKEHGIDINPKALNKSFTTGDMFYRDENRKSPIEKRDKHGQFTFYLEYLIRVLKGAGADISKEMAIEMLTEIQKWKWEFKTFDDTIPTLKLFKDRGMILGLISNVGRDIEDTCINLGLKPYLDFNVTSFEVGCDKPNPEIFQVAIGKAKVKPEEAIYVGDQYDLDVVGARNVGMSSVLIDRNNMFADINDCPRIQTLSELTNFIHNLH